MPAPNPICNDSNRHFKRAALEFEKIYRQLFIQPWQDKRSYIARIWNYPRSIERIHYYIYAFSIDARP